MHITYINTETDTYTHTDIHRGTHTCIHTHIYTEVHIHLHTDTHGHTQRHYIHVPRYTHAQSRYERHQSKS